jgi:hypothetical protein
VKEAKTELGKEKEEEGCPSHRVLLIGSVIGSRSARRSRVARAATPTSANETVMLRRRRADGPILI